MIKEEHVLVSVTGVHCLLLLRADELPQLTAGYKVHYKGSSEQLLEIKRKYSDDLEFLYEEKEAANNKSLAKMLKKVRGKVFG